MSKKAYIIIMVVVCILGIGYWLSLGQREELQVYSENVFCFDGIPIGYSEELFLKEKTDVSLLETRQGVYNGEEHVYNKEFESAALKRNIAVYYYFDESGFQRGNYEIVFDEKEKAQVFDSAYEFFRDKLYKINNEIHFELDNFEGRFSSAWKHLQTHENEKPDYMLPDGYEEIYYSDDENNILRIGYYILPNTDGKQHVLEVEIYKKSDWKELIGNTNWANGWPQEIEMCWNVETDANVSRERVDLEYSQRMRLIRFAADQLWAMNRENGELKHYKISDDCVIWALLDPASYGAISFELLVKSEQNDRVRDWILGVNAEGEIEHIYEAMLP